jgi:translation initiation factor eIF-2B subunit delta
MTHLSPQISYLVSARPMSVSMGNAIRQLKLEISNTDIDMVEQDVSDSFRSTTALSHVCDFRPKTRCVKRLIIIYAIESSWPMRLSKDLPDKRLTMATSSLHMPSHSTQFPFACHLTETFFFRSSVVQKVLLNAHEEGKRFSVIVVDSQPLLEGT